VAENDNGDFSIDGFTADQLALNDEFSIAYICWRAARTKTAVLPIPDFA